MVVLNTSGEEINAKIVYYGPGVSGKTTNLEYIHEKMPVRTKGKLVSMKTRTDRTLFFDFLPIELGEINGYRTRFLLYTVPGQVYYNATRKLVLNGADAVVFVADSSRAKLQENIESLRNLEDNLNEHGMSLDHMPWVIQYNKRDVPDAMTVDEMHDQLNLLGVPAFEAVAVEGGGVYETFQGIAALLYEVLKRRLERGGDAAGAPPQKGQARADDLSVTVDSALREVPAPDGVERPEYQAVGAPAAPRAAPSEPTNRAQSVGSPTGVRPAARAVGGTAGQPVASAREIPAAPPDRRAARAPSPERAVADDSFVFDELPSTADATDQGSARRIAEAEVASEVARGEASPEFIIDPMGRKPRSAPAPEPKPASPGLPGRERQRTVELHDEPSAQRFDDVAVPEAADDATVTIPVTVSAEKLRPGRPLRLVLELHVVDD